MYGETTTSGCIPSSCTCIILYILPTVYKSKKEKNKKQNNRAFVKRKERQQCYVRELALVVNWSIV